MFHLFPLAKPWQADHVLHLSVCATILFFVDQYLIAYGHYNLPSVPKQNDALPTGQIVPHALCTKLHKHT